MVSEIQDTHKMLSIKPCQEVSVSSQLDWNSVGIILRHTSVKEFVTVHWGFGVVLIFHNFHKPVYHAFSVVKRLDICGFGCKPQRGFSIPHG